MRPSSSLSPEILEQLCPYGKLSGADLSELNLSDRNLSGANLSVADLSRTDLVNTALRHAELDGANLIQAVLIDADLRQANLGRANLCRANLSGADLFDANLAGVDLRETILLRASLRAAYLVGADLRYANLIEANLYGAQLDGVNLGPDTMLLGANLAEATGATPFHQLRDLQHCLCFLTEGEWRYADMPRTLREQALLCILNLSPADIKRFGTVRIDSDIDYDLAAIEGGLRPAGEWAHKDALYLATLVAYGKSQSNSYFQSLLRQLYQDSPELDLCSSEDWYDFSA